MADPEQILWCIKNGNLEDLKKSLGECKVNDPSLTSSRPLLHTAADFGQTKIVEYLVDNGCDVNFMDKHGITPLLAALWEEHKETVEVLLKKGAKKDLKSPGGNSYEDEAPNKELKELLRKY